MGFLSNSDKPSGMKELNYASSEKKVRSDKIKSYYRERKKTTPLNIRGISLSTYTL